jgi:hypothetical protein
MSADRLAVYTTIYPGVEPCLAEWLRSVDAQSDRNFDLWIGLDTLTPDDVAAACGRACTAEWVRMTEVTPAEIRSRSLETLVERYPAVVLVDSDDLLHPSRVSAARQMLRGPVKFTAKLRCQVASSIFRNSASPPRSTALLSTT